ncbi:uncharacterized protein LOC106152255 [Lingula anatina]|uniref:Uncharacterized protein LOC106152255 n=1 Tax=Lingula anatina TaxID=7574 RepID=A0A1S3H6W9_LINAN|nr:uncharacterized protein LOC106152255 [Lingula anatina]|eukprot:XP_013381226.2 uncharacterized protein LOC106152255 [Lingula anatina]
MNLAKKSEETPIITIEKLMEMAQRVGLPDGELQEKFIPYHHRQGDILHFKIDGLENVVIIDPLWLADVFSAIMTPASIHSGCSRGHFLKDELERGVLKEEVFDEYLKEFKMAEKKTEIIRLMLHFDLMLEISQSVENPLPGHGKRRFIVPSMLVSNNSANETNPQKYLLIAFPHILFPTGLFHRLIIRLLRKYKAQQYKNNIPVVGFDSASFRLADKQSVLHLAIENKAMKLFITNATGLPPKTHVYSEATKTVENELTVLRDTYCPRMHFGYSIRLKNDGPNIPINALDVQTDDSICVYVENSEVSVDLRPYRVWFSAAPENQDRRAAKCPENEYKNDSEPRGRALIINNKIFSVDWLPERDGTEVDVVALRKLFRYLHYETDVISNLTADEMKEEIEQESQRDDHKIYDSFILFLLSHGTEGAVYGTDGYPLPFKYIKAILNNRNCLGLSGKPKMIFIQACQGKILDSGTLLDRQTVQQPQQAPPAANLGDEVPDAPHEIPKPSNDPTMSDFLEVHATSPDYVSWRHTGKGTWFVQSIVDTFYREAHKYDVLQMLVNVNYAISQKQTIKGNKQAPEIVTSLRKKVFFNITPGEEESVQDQN